MAQLIETRVDEFVTALERDCAAAGRALDGLTVLLATKTQSPEAIRTAVNGFREHGLEVIVGENRVQELVAKAAVFAELGTPAHLIGPLQSNKINAALRALFISDGTTEQSGHSIAPPRRPCIQTIASLDTAERIAARLRPEHRLDVMIQVNSSGEASKSGVAPESTLALAEQILQLSQLCLTGLMTIGPRDRDPDRTADAFLQVRTLRDEISQLPSPDAHRCVHLSMGMSEDISAAIRCGSTIIRPGRAIFGDRAAPPK
ncbi:hypothetical protein SAMN06309944_2098 [Micrococcales bacterium KH10]|nr:hypothetical protein SAMN06309944_2098 [Micrococcales bacterium KH10]